MRAKRRAIAIILFAAAKGLEVSTDKLKEALAKDLAKGLEGTERDRVKKLYKHARQLIEHTRSLADTLWNTSKKK